MAAHRLELLPLEEARPGVVLRQHLDRWCPVIMRRIAPGLIHMLDSFFAALVLERLHEQQVRDVVMIHDAWLVPLDAEKRLTSAISAAGEPWLRGLGPIYDVFDRYLTGRLAEVAREWRDRWEARIADCTAGRDQWPLFLVKRESAKEDYRLAGGSSTVAQ